MNMLIISSSKPTFKLFSSKLIFLSNKCPQLKFLRLFGAIKSIIRKTLMKLMNLSISLSGLGTAPKNINAYTNLTFKS